MPSERAQPPSDGRHGFRNKALVVIGLLIAGVSLWLFLAEPNERAPAEAETATSRRVLPPPAPRAPDPRPEPETQLAAAAPSGSDPHAPDEPAHAPGDHSHPITPDHLRLYRENKHIHTIDNAILVKDHEAVRRLNAEYRKEYPADDHALQDAYEMIADCLEEKTPERVARARSFWETRRSSQARRDIRRICLQ